ncbi:hypothetical protein H0H92_005005 [Tricholoma furcatifolium]|nr:hypothetical protein H0H92_005005 [Tricholoma furcatifolium]
MPDMPSGEPIKFLLAMIVDHALSVTASVLPIVSAPSGYGPYRDEDVLLSLQLLAYLSKHPHIRQAFYKPRVTFHPASIDVVNGRWSGKSKEDIKYCRKECQSTAWSEGHRFWCSAKDDDDATAAAAAEAAVGTAVASATLTAPTDARQERREREQNRERPMTTEGQTHTMRGQASNTSTGTLRAEPVYPSDMPFAPTTSRGANTMLRPGYFSPHQRQVVPYEVHNIKNKKTKGAKACCKLKAKFRWFLTGTPMQNNVNKLYSLLKFLRIKPYNNLQKFNEDIAQPVKIGRGASRAVKRLQVILEQIMLRRQKDQQLNRKVLIELSEHTAFYTALENKMEGVIEKLMGNCQSNYMSVLLLLLQLRQACDHPMLVAQDYKTDMDAVEPQSKKDQDPAQDNDTDDLIGAFANLGVTRRCKGEEKTIIFLQFKKMLDLIELFLRDEGIEYVQLLSTTAENIDNNNDNHVSRSRRQGLCAFAIQNFDTRLNGDALSAAASVSASAAVTSATEKQKGNATSSASASAATSTSLAAASASASATSSLLSSQQLNSGG